VRVIFMDKYAVVRKNDLDIGTYEDGRWIILIRIFREEWGEYSILFCLKRAYDFFADSPELIEIIRNMKNNSLEDIGQDLVKAGYRVNFKR